MEQGGEVGKFPEGCAHSMLSWGLWTRSLGALLNACPLLFGDMI